MVDTGYQAFRTVAEGILASGILSATDAKNLQTAITACDKAIAAWATGITTGQGVLVDLEAAFFAVLPTLVALINHEKQQKAQLIHHGQLAPKGS